ncbi:MAG TPA: hypothetical protein VMV04_05320 [Thermodesulfobacteriota bacterium]|nr:hypothetical protein [Thermodesulfobacteriota bacterium]
MEKDPSLEQQNAENSFISLLKGGTKTPESGDRPSLDEQNIPSWPTLFAELSQSVKDNLEKIKSLVYLSREKFADREYSDFFYRTISNDIAKTDALLSCFANYLKINTPVPKKYSVHMILDEVLKKYESLLEDKKVRIFKQHYAENLPETSIHEEQLRFILNSVLRYAIPSIPPQGSIGFLTRSLEAQEIQDEGKSKLQADGNYVEILTGFNSCKNGSEPLEAVLVDPTSPQKEKDDFILRLAEEIIKVNRGTMKMRVDPEKSITLISLILPVERRKKPQFQPTTS